MTGALTQVVVLLATAVLAVVVFRRLHLPPILAYLSAGVLAGPGGPGWVGDCGSGVWDFFGTVRHLERTSPRKEAMAFLH